MGYRRAVIPVTPSRNLVSSVGHRVIEIIPPARHQYPYVDLSRSFTGTNRTLSIDYIRRPGVLSAGRGHAGGGPLAGAGGVTKSPYLQYLIHGRET